MRFAAAIPVVMSLVPGLASAGPVGNVRTAQLATAPSDLAAGPSQRFLFSAGSDGLRVIDVARFETLPDIIDVGAEPVAVAVTGGDRPCVVTANSDGSVSVFYEDLLEDVADLLEAFDDTNVVSAALLTNNPNFVDVAADPDTDLAWIADSTTAIVYQIDAEGPSSLPEPTGLDITVGRTPRALHRVVTSTGLRIYVSTSDGLIATVFNGATPSLTVAQDLAGAPDLAAMTSAVVNAEAHVFVLDVTTPAVHEIGTSGNVLIGSAALPAGSTPTGIATIGEGNSQRVAVMFDNPPEVRFYDPANSFALSEGPIALTGTAGPATGISAGYAFAAAGTAVDILTPNPFLSGMIALPNPIENDVDPVTFQFTSDLSASWTLHVGGTLDIAGRAASTAALRSGTASAGEVQSVEVPAEELNLAEGQIPFWVLATETGTGVIGHGGGRINFDLPPDAVGDFRVGFGNGRIFAHWSVLDTADIARYEIHFGTDAGATNGLPSRPSPEEVLQPDPVIIGQDITHRFEPVVNGTEVFVYVIAYDNAGNPSQPTAILSATAQPTAGVCDQNNKPCDRACSVVNPQGGNLLAALLCALVLGFGVWVRKRTADGVRALVIAAAASLLLVPAVSEAQVVDESPKWGTFSFGGGIYLPDSVLIRDVYGDNRPATDIRVSGLLFSIVDVGVSAGFQQWNGRGVGTVDGNTSDDLYRLTLFPLTASVLLRLDFFREQPVVPFVGGGLTYIDYTERDVFSDRNFRGSEFGWVGSAGLMLLLDYLEHGRADDLDTYWGVNDTYLILQADRFQVDNFGQGANLELSGWRATASLMFAF